MTDATESLSVPLGHGQRLLVEPAAGGSVLRLVAADGQVALTVRATPAGPVLQFAGGLAIQADGDLAVSARRVALHGREGIDLSTGGDLTVAAAGDVTSTARVQTITADRGNVNLKANDDIKLNGERVMVNC